MQNVLPRANHPVLLTLILLLLCSSVSLGAALQPMLMLVGILILATGAAVVIYPTFGLYVMFAFFLIQGSPLYESYGIFARTYTASDAVGGLVLLGWFLQSMKPGARRPFAALDSRGRLAIAVVAAYFVWAGLSSAWSQAPLAQLSDSVRYSAEGGMLFALAVLLLNEPQKVLGAAATYAVTGMILALYTIVTFVGNHGFDTSFLISTSQVYRGGLPASLNANALATILAVVPGFAYLAVKPLPRRYRLILTSATVPVIGLALIILTSRQIFVSAALAVVAISLLGRGVGNRLAIAPVVLLGAGTFLALMSTGHVPTYFQNRITAAQYDNLNARLPIWSQGFDAFAGHPLFGVGAEGLEVKLPLSNLDTSAQSDFVRTLADYGLVGFALLLVMLVVLGRIIIFDGGRNAASIGIAVILLVSMTVGSMLKEHWMWVALSIVCCFGLVTGAPEDALAAEPGPAPTDGILRRQGLSSSLAGAPISPPQA
jgi:O-antigen ligase